MLYPTFVLRLSYIYLIIYIRPAVAFVLYYPLNRIQPTLKLTLLLALLIDRKR